MSLDVATGAWSRGEMPWLMTIRRFLVAAAAAGDIGL